MISRPASLLEPATPKRWPGGSAAQRAAWIRARRKTARDLRRGTVPPPPSAFGAFGASYIVPPVRVDNPRFIFIGDGVHVLEFAWFSIFKMFDDIDPRFEVGDRTRIGRYCQFSCVGDIIIERNVGISDCVLLADTAHSYENPEAAWFEQEMMRPERITIRTGAVVGFGAIVLPGVTIGRNAYVQDNAVVNVDVPDGAVVRGNPARVVGERGAP
jgi:acetyltransferase-like isoleucine patch superfamily enzyme